MNEPLLPRKREDPARFELGSGIGHHPNTPKDLLCQDYFECLDKIVACICDRLKNLEDSLLRTARNENYN